MQFINPTVEQLVEDVQGKNVDRANIENELETLETALTTLGDIEEIESDEERFRSKNIRSSVVNVDGLTLTNFSMVTSMMFTHEGYVFFSNGIHAISLRLMAENYKEALNQILANLDSE